MLNIQWILQLIPDSIFSWITYLLFATGVIVYVASKFVGLFPFISRYKLVAELGGIAALIVSAYFYGGIEYRNMVAELKNRVAIAEKLSADANVALENKTKEHLKAIKEATSANKTIIQEVAGKQIDNICRMPRSAISLHNSASGNEVARGPGAVDGTPTDIKASQFLEVVIDNYGACHANIEKLRAWQEWYTTQKNIFDSIK